jgi:transcription-repair coupling factor (superfamily II helicase)
VRRFKEEAGRLLVDPEQNDWHCPVLSRPYRRPYQIEDTDNARASCRSAQQNQFRKKPAIIVTYPEALFEKSSTQRFEKTLKSVCGR